MSKKIDIDVLVAKINEHLSSLDNMEKDEVYNTEFVIAKTVFKEFIDSLVQEELAVSDEYKLICNREAEYASKRKAFVHEVSKKYTLTDGD